MVGEGLYIPRRNFATPPSPSQIYHALVTAGTRIRPLQQVHACMVVSGLHCIRSLFTKLITLAGASAASNSGYYYIRCLLHSAPNPDGFLFNTLIRISSKFHRASSADSIFFYRQMWSEGIQPSSYSFTALLKSCGDHSALRLGRLLHSHAFVNGLDENRYVQTALVAFYSKCGDLVIARMVFDRMRERGIVAWNSIISGYQQNGFADEAVDLFFQMNEDAATEADSATLVSLVSACSQLGRSDFGEWVRDYMSQKGIELNAILGTSLINMYSRCSDVRKAREVFNELKERNVVSWTAMISGYGMHGHGDEALALFLEMISDRVSICPNDVTFVAILSACGHAGLVDQGRKVFASMKRDHQVIPKMEHHVCMVDMLGRAGLLDEAIDFIRKHIPTGSAGPEVWTAMVGACKLHKNFKLGVEAAERLVCTEPDNPGHYVLLSNLYALAGMTAEVETVRNKMVRRRLRKQVGYSMIEIDQVGHVFRMGDRSHSQAPEIYRCLEELTKKG